MSQLKNLYKSIPRAIRIFLVRAICVFVVWQALYHYVLMPIRVPDKALTNFTCASTVKALSLFYPGASGLYITNDSQVSALILVDGAKVMGISDPCNALDIYVLYLSFLFCFPGNVKRRLTFAAAGIPVIYCFNVLRCMLMTWIHIAHRAWFDVSHHYIFTTIMYVLIFAMWILYTKKPRHAA